MPNFSLTLDLSALYASMAPSFEVLIDGVVEASFSVTSSYTATDYSFSSASAVPSIQLRFKDDFSESGRSILINDIQINGVSVAGANIDKGMLLQQELANINTASESSSFGVVPPGGGTFAVAAPTIASFGGATVTGTAGNDIYLGGDVVDSDLEVFDALGGNDIVRGHGNDDAIFLRAGDDRGYGGGGNDTLVGGTGDDYLRGDAGNDILWGEEDNDRLLGGDGDDTLYGGIGDDKLTGNADVDTLYGEEGNDVLNGGSGADFLYGGDDNDTLFGGADDDTMEGGSGDDRLVGGNGDDNMIGEAGDDTLDGGRGNDIIDGGADDDVLLGRAGNDTLTGGTGNDTLFDEDGDDILNGGDGNDTLVGGRGADTLNGDNNDDILHGHGLNAQEIGTILRANAGVVFNAETNSFYQFVSTLDGWADHRAAANATIINGVAGHLANITSAAENTFIYDLGLVNGASATQRVWLGGSDAAVEGEWRWVDGAEAGLQFSQDSTVTNNLYENWTAGQPNNLSGNQHYATLHYNGADGWDDIREDVSVNYYTVIEWDAGLMSDDNAIDTLNGGLGNDMLYGYGGADILQGGDGNDTVLGGAGDDNIDGGDGTDSLYGGDNDDTITGGVGDDYIEGNDGDDTINGNADNDIIHGNDGDDILNGDAGDDVLIGDDIDLSDSAVAYYKLDEASGTTITDYSGNGRNGTYDGTPVWDTTGGQLQGAIDFRGQANDDISVGTWDVTGSGITLSAWINQDNITNDARIITKTNGGSFTNHDWAILINNNASGTEDRLQLRMTTVNGYETNELEGIDFSDYLDSWNHVAVTYDDTTDLITYYINGEAVGTDTHGPGGAVITGSGKEIAIGNNPVDGYGNRQFDGFIDEVRIHDQELSSAEISDLYNMNFSGSGGTGADILDGGAGDDTLYGGGGDDTLRGGSDDDIIIGQDGDDTLNGDGGDDTIFGGDDDDTVTGGTGNDVLYGGLGDDDLDAGANDDTVYGGAGNDIIDSASGTNLLIGADGNDTITGGTGNDTIYGDSIISATEEGLVAYYKMDESSGTTVTDYSGNGHTGTYVGGTPTWDTTGGAINGAIDFSGASFDDINIGTFDVEGSGITLSAWVNQDNTTTDARIISKTDGSATNNHDWALILNDTGGGSRIQFRLTTVNGTRSEELVGYDFSQHLDTWTHLAVTYDDTTDLVTYYVNGEAVGTDTHNDGGAVITGTGEQISIGNQPNDAYGDRQFDGLIDETRIYERELSASEIAEMYRDLVDDGDDIIDGGAGVDIIEGGTGDDVIDGGDDNDTINGGAGVDIIKGGTGDDTINGGVGNDTIEGGTGDDVIDGGDGNDTIYSTDVAGAAVDQIAIILAANPTVTYNESTGNFYEWTAPVTNITKATAVAAVGLNLLSGVGAHLATVVTTEEQAEIAGIVTAGSNNWAWLDGSDSVTEGTFLFESGPEAGTAFDNSVLTWWGGSPASTNTAARDDVIIWDGGGDVLFVWPNAYGYVSEWEGNAVLGTGANTASLSGGAGLDTLYGADGVLDTFIFESGSAFNDVDVINRFTAGDSDTIDISDLLTGYTAGVSDINDFVQFTNSGANTLVQVDANGTTGGASFVSVAQINGVNNLDADALLHNASIIA